MKIFDFKNPKHVKILREELKRVKRILSEGAQFSMDEIWKEMSNEERTTALLASADDAGPDLADNYSDSDWDSIPADVQDRLDLSAFELAKYDTETGHRNLRFIKSMSSDDAGTKLVDAYLKNVDRANIDCLTKKQASDLLLKLAKLKKQLRGQMPQISNQPKNNPYDMPGGSASKGYMGSKYTGD
jgi:hypothetical protein